MAHHGQDLPVQMKESALGTFLGPTHKYPMGKLCPEDAGEIAIGIAADLNTDRILINFGAEVSWLGLTVDQAKSIATTLIAKAMEIQTTAH